MMYENRAEIPALFFCLLPAQQKRMPISNSPQTRMWQNAGNCIVFALFVLTRRSMLCYAESGIASNSFSNLIYVCNQASILIIYSQASARIV
jgi:hypothetical protein